jgi:hypothetical protein
MVFKEVEDFSEAFFSIINEQKTVSKNNASTGSA